MVFWYAYWWSSSKWSCNSDYYGSCIWCTYFIQYLYTSQPYLFIDLQCPIYSKLVYAPLCCYVQLVYCQYSYRKDVSGMFWKLWSILIVIICLLATLLSIFTVHENQPPELREIQCVNFTPPGYIFYATITSIHLFPFYFIYIVMNTVVLVHLLRHRRRFVDSDSLSTQICLILRKQKHFLYLIW
jgi:hypothetical protein